MAKRRISIKTAISRYVPKGARLLAAVSGGRDSVVLLHALLQAQKALQIHVEVAHVDHGLRESSGDDARFVSGWCTEVGIQCHVRRLAEPARGDNVESWARRERYAALSQIRMARNLDFILTAHTANDVAETLLMRLIAKKELTTIEDTNPRRCVLRPLLEVGRDQIDEYVSRYRVPYVEDLSNMDTKFVRNRVRHELLPLLAGRFDPSIVWILSEQAGSLARDCDALRSWALMLATEIGSLQEGDKVWLQRCQRVMQGVPHAVRWRAVQLLAQPLFGFSVGEAKASAILSVFLGETSAIEVHRGVFLKLSGESILIAGQGE